MLAGLRDLAAAARSRSRAKIIAVFMSAIPVAGRVMALVDVYDAVRARTLYRQCRSHDDTVEFIVGGKGTHFDPGVVDAFLSVAARFKSASDEALADNPQA